MEVERKAKIEASTQTPQSGKDRRSDARPEIPLQPMVRTHGARFASRGAGLTLAAAEAPRGGAVRRPLPPPPREAPRATRPRLSPCSEAAAQPPPALPSHGAAPAPYSLRGPGATGRAAPPPRQALGRAPPRHLTAGAAPVAGLRRSLELSPALPSPPLQ
ncbi:uncharacterized protein LOC133625828 [Colius striatus]|uniref:uncharacterized protein LOC133625828 n=1 Tax=Colius striatus TaxID=57412 RepID=UPI002B1E454B|nr:uncharacterized protein LOC133625828 [Colius striatus]